MFLLRMIYVCETSVITMPQPYLIGCVKYTLSNVGDETISNLIAA